MADNFLTVAPESTAPVALPIATKQLDDASHAGVTVIVDKAGARARSLEITAANAAKVDGSAVTQPVSGPLTDAQLRAATVPVSGTVATGGLTDAQLRATAVPVSGTVTANAGTGTLAVSLASVPSHAVTNIGTFAVQAALSAGVNNIGDVDVLTLPALPSGTNNIGDVDVLTLPALPAGTNEIGKVGLAPQTTGGLTTFHLVSAATTNATNVKASAGQLFGYFIFNNATTMRKVAFHNSASAPTAGAAIFFTIAIPGGSAANVEFSNGIAFSAGIGITTVTDLTDAGATAVALSDLNVNLFYK